MRAVIDGENVAHSTLTVTTLGAEFVRGLERTRALEDFPAAGQTVAWQEALQHFTPTARE